MNYNIVLETTEGFLVNTSVESNNKAQLIRSARVWAKSENLIDIARVIVCDRNETGLAFFAVGA